MERLDRVGGVLAILISVGLLAMVLVRDAGVNVGNGWTIALGMAGGAVAWRGWGRWSRLEAIMLIVAGALPATVFVGLGLVYLVPIVLIALGRSPSVERRAARGAPGR